MFIAAMAGTYQMNEAELDDYSRSFYELLIRRYPHWRTYARVLTCDDCRGSLFVEIPAPPTGQVDLWLRAQDGHVTNGVDRYCHGHFVAYPPVDNATVFSAALQFLTGFLSEQLVLAVAFSGTQPGSSWILQSDGDVRCPELPAASMRHDRLCVFSWHSTHDRIISNL